jgi:hypothetical protein
MNDTELMAQIKKNWGPAIRAAVAGTPFPESFLAALAANESSGDINATRFEAAELGEFALVFVGKRNGYQGLTDLDLVSALSGLFSVRAAAARLVQLCTSWGPTQIMGWQSIRGKYAITDLLDPTKHFYQAVRLLEDFRVRFGMSAEMCDAEEGQLLRCWNTGRPDGELTDPKYELNGLARIAIYEKLP